MSSEQKVAIITGASQGIGAGLVKAFRDRNYRVVATSRSIEQTGDQDIVAVRGDIGDPATAEAVVREAISRFGRIDTLVNNAGIFISKPFTDYTAEDFDTKIATNLAGFFHITQRVAAEMLKQGSGHIVSITTSLVDHAIGGVPIRARQSHQGRHQLGHQGAGDRICHEGHPRERRLPRHHQDPDAHRGNP